MCFVFGLPHAVEVMPLPYELKLCPLAQVFSHDRLTWQHLNLLLDQSKSSLCHSFSTYCSPCNFCESNFHTVLNLYHSCNQGSAVFLYQVFWADSSDCIIHCKLYPPLKLQFFSLLGCDLHLVSRYNLFFNSIDTLFSSPMAGSMNYRDDSSPFIPLKTSSWSLLDFYDATLCHMQFTHNGIYLQFK